MMKERGSGGSKKGYLRFYLAEKEGKSFSWQRRLLCPIRGHRIKKNRDGLQNCLEVRGGTGRNYFIVKIPLKGRKLPVFQNREKGLGFLFLAEKEGEKGPDKIAKCREKKNPIQLARSGKKERVFVPR